MTALCTGMRKLLDQKRPRRSSDRLPGEHFRPTARFCHARFSVRYTSASAFQRVPPSHFARFHGTDQSFRPVQPLREYGRSMGSDSHPRILRLSPLTSRRVDYLRLSRVFRQMLLLRSNDRMQEDEQSSIPLLGSAFCLIRPFRGFTGNRRVSLPVKGR